MNYNGEDHMLTRRAARRAGMQERPAIPDDPYTVMNMMVDAHKEVQGNSNTVKKHDGHYLPRLSRRQLHAMTKEDNQNLYKIELCVQVAMWMIDKELPHLLSGRLKYPPLLDNETPRFAD